MDSIQEIWTDSLLMKKIHSAGYRKETRKQTESEIVATQDQVLHMKYYGKKILKAETESTCRLCQKFDETADHIILACPILAKEQYIKRFDRVGAQLHYNICKEMGV